MVPLPPVLDGLNELRSSRLVTGVRVSARYLWISGEKREAERGSAGEGGVGLAERADTGGDRSSTYRRLGGWSMHEVFCIPGIRGPANGLRACP